jgi:hypothetical protein
MKSQAPKRRRRRLPWVKLRLLRPVGKQKDLSIELIAVGTHPKLGKLRAEYLLPRAVARRRGDILDIGAGDISTSPAGCGVGRSFMDEHVLPLFQQIATRSNRRLSHLPSIAYAPEARALFRNRGYVRERRVFVPDNKPRRLPPNAELALKLLMGKGYVTARAARERLKRAKLQNKR